MADKWLILLPLTVAGISFRYQNMIKWQTVLTDYFIQILTVFLNNNDDDDDDDDDDDNNNNNFKG